MNKTKRYLMMVISTILLLVMMFSMVSNVLAQEIKTEIIKSSPTYGATNDEAQIRPGNIIGEDKTKRDEFTKYFITDTGSTIVAQYGVPVHYKNSEDEYIDFDNTLVTTQETVVNSTYDESSVDEVLPASYREIEEVETAFTNKKSNSKVSHFKKSGKVKLIEITKDGHTISWNYSGANIVTAKEQMEILSDELYGNESFLTLTNLSSKVVYENIYNNIDLEVINSTVGIKENLILKAPNAKNVYKLEYDIGDLVAESVDEHTIVLKSDDKVVYTITAPYMADANGVESKAVELKLLSNNKGKLSVKLTADKDWLKDKDRVYPVTIDPYFEYGQAWGEVHSTYISQYQPDQCFGPGSSGYEGSIYVGRPVDDGETDYIRRSLVKIPNLPELGTGDMLINAQIEFRRVDNDPTQTMYVGLYEATGRSWEQDRVTWNLQPTCSSELIDYEKLSTSDFGWICWDITELAKKWYNGETNNGFFLKMMDEATVEQGVRFVSASYPDESEYRPVMRLEYRNNKGIEDYWDYTSVQVGTAGTAYVNNYSGSMVFVTDIADTHSLSMPTELSLTYNSYMAGKQSNVVSPHSGSGWNMNIQETLLESNEDILGNNHLKYPYVYTDSDGTEHYFEVVTENGVSKMVDDSGYGMELTVDDVHDFRVIRLKDGRRICFDSEGRLQYKTDTLENEIRVNYSGNKISSIEDNDENMITIEDENADGYIDKVVEPDGKITTFTYAVNNNICYLTQIARADGTKVNFEYTDKMLTTIKDVDGSKVCFLYSGGDIKRVTEIQEYGGYGLVGQKMAFNYEKHNTTEIQSSGTDCTFDTEDDIVTVYQFDDKGRNVSKYSKGVSGNKYLGAVASKFTEATNSGASSLKQLNKVVQNYSVGANRENLIVGHNLESSISWNTDNWDSQNGMNSVSISASKYLYGAKSLKMQVGSAISDYNNTVYQNVSSNYLEGDATYTLSCYVNVDSIAPVSGAQNYGAVMYVDYYFNGSVCATKRSNFVSTVTEDDINDGFRRISVTFEVPSNLNYIRVYLAFQSATGTAYFDGVQLEKAQAAGDYNMLENASFERYNDNGAATSWPGTGLTVGTSDYKKRDSVDGEYSFSISGEADVAKNAHQDVVVRGNKADTYVLSGWAKGNAVPNKTNNSYFELRVKIFYSDDSSIQKRSALFNTSVSDWQYSSFAFNLDDGVDNDAYPTEIRVYVISFRQGNRVEFDNLQLIKDAVPTYVYDTKGNLEQIISNAEQVSKYDYNEDDKLIWYQEPKGQGFDYNYTYNNENDLLETFTTQKGAVYNYQYNDVGNITSIKASSNSTPHILKKTEYSVDENNNNVIKIYNNDGKPITKKYNSEDGTLKLSTDAKGTTYYYYNTGNDKLTDVVRRNHHVSYNYSSIYKYLTGINHGNTQYNFSYTYFGDIAFIRVGNSNLMSYTYGPNNGNLEKITYANGDTREYSYNDYGRANKLFYNGTEVGINYTDNSGSIVRSVDYINDREMRVTYDSTGRLVAKDTLNSNDLAWQRSIEYNYDRNNNISNLIFADSSGINNKVAYTYTDDNLPETTKLHNGKIQTIVYDELGRLVSKSLNVGGLSSAYTYHQSSVYGTGYTTTRVATEETSAFAYNYKYTSNGNIEYIYKGVLGDNGYTYNSTPMVKYEYDEYGQLVVVNDYENCKKYKYTYDNAGNIIEQSCDIMYSYSNWKPAGNSVVYTYEYENSNWGDLLTGYNGSSITYDEMGNPITYRDGMTMTWSNGTELQSISNNGAVVNFKYDLAGLRTRKTVNTIQNGSTAVKNVEYVYEQGKLLRMKDGSKILDFTYDANGSPISVAYRSSSTSNVGYYYYGVNAQGDVVALYNSTGAIVALYNYDAYGKLLSVKSATGAIIDTESHIAILNPLRYRSYVYDNETGLYYLQSRYYDPNTARFINPDTGFLSTGQSIISNNRFVYCNNNPMAYTDSNGMRPIAGTSVANETSTERKISCAWMKAQTKETPSIEPDDEPSEEEYSYAATVYAEAGGQNNETKQAVAHVINNRVNTDPEWDSIEAVMCAPNQFDGYGDLNYQAAMEYYTSGVCDNDIDKAAMDECLAVVIPIYNGRAKDTTGGALYFHSYSKPDYWEYHNDYTLVEVPGTEEFWFYK